MFHEPTTGASSDIDQATKIARAMVTEYGMSARLGAVRYGREQGDPFLGRSMGNQADYSLEVAHEIDEEVRKLIEAAHTEAWEILNTYRDVLDDLVFELLEKETLTRKDLERIFDQVEKRPRITAFNDFGGRTPSDKPPIQTPAERASERGEPWPPQIEPEREPAPVGSYPGGATAWGRPGRTAARRPPPRLRVPGVRSPTRRTRTPPGQQPVGAERGAAARRHPRGAAERRRRTNYGAPPDWRPATTPAGQSWPPTAGSTRGQHQHGGRSTARRTAVASPDQRQPRSGERRRSGSARTAAPTTVPAPRRTRYALTRHAVRRRAGVRSTERPPSVDRRGPRRPCASC